MNETLLTIPMELAGNWGHMVPGAAKLGVERMRQACLAEVRLVSDRQPKSLRIDEHMFGSPAVWLHSDPRDVAWIIVDIGPQDWSKLAYQFGHELGHVMANSWRQDAKPAPPMSMAGRGDGGGVLDSWARPSCRPLEAGSALRQRQPVWRRDRHLSSEHHTTLRRTRQGGTSDFAGWFVNHRVDIEAQALGLSARAVSLSILTEYEGFPDCVEGLGALNRWPGRTGVPIADYLRLWEASCRELKASPRLPLRLRELLRVA